MSNKLRSSIDKDILAKFGIKYYQSNLIIYSIFRLKKFPTSQNWPR
jgi:hypothetical protein